MKTKYTLLAAHLIVLFLASCEYQEPEVPTPSLVIVLYDVSVSTHPLKGERLGDNCYPAYLKKHIVADQDKVLLAFIGSSGVNTARAKAYQVSYPDVANPEHNEIEAISANRIYKQRLQEQIDSLLILVKEELSQTPRDALHTGILELFPLIQTAIENHQDYSIKVLMVSDMLQDSEHFQLTEAIGEGTEIKIQNIPEAAKWKDSTAILLKEQFGIENEGFMKPISEVMICSPCYANSAVNCPENMGYVEEYWQQVFQSYGARGLNYSVSK